MADEKNLKDELTRLGFPDKVIEETVAAKEKGLFDREPSPDLAEKIMERCRPLLPKPKEP